MHNLKELRSLAMKITNKIKGKDLGFGFAQKQSWKVVNAKKSMRKNLVNIIYKRTDGTYKTAIATLCPALLPERKASKTNRKKFVKPVNQISYYNIELQKWESFKAEKLVSVGEVVTIASIVQSTFIQSQALKVA